MDDEIKAYRIRFSDSDNGYIIACRAQGSLNQLLDKLKSCPDCVVAEIPRDMIQDDQTMGKIYLEQVKGDC